MRFLVLIVLMVSTSAFSQKINYRLSMPQPTTHEYHVEIEMNAEKKPYIDFVMPAWSPGRYTIQNFAKSVSDVAAVSAGKKLIISKIDKQTWRIQTKGIGIFQLNYKVFANNLNGTFSVLDADHANYNGASLFMYADGFRNRQVNLTIHPFGGWKVYNGYSTDENQTRFEFPNYDLLIDTPTEIGFFTVYSQTIRGKAVRVLIHDEDSDTSGTADFLQKIYAITEAQYRAMPELDYKTYTYMIHFSKKPNTFGDGMEHFNSTQVVVKGSLKNPANRMSALETVSHEHFHSWNVKRLRPENIGPHELTKELYSPLLWFSEGFTEYYQPLSMVRAKVISLEEFRKQILANIAAFSQSEGRQKRTTAESSTDTWYWTNSSYDNNFSYNWYSYYSQGMTIGIMMDLKIRKESKNKLSLDGFMSHMYNKFYVKEKGNWYYKGKPFTENDVFTELEFYTQSKWGNFRKSYIHGFDDVDESLFSDFGLKLTSDTTKNWDSGLTAVANDKGFLRISAIREGSDTERSSFQTGDIITAVNGISSIDKTLPQVLSAIKPGESVSFELIRNQKLLVISLTAKQPKIGRKLTITDEKNQLLKEWLNL